MARNLDARCRQCRREGEKLFLKAEKCFTDKCAIERRKCGKFKQSGNSATVEEARPPDHILMEGHDQASAAVVGAQFQQLGIGWQAVHAAATSAVAQCRHCLVL